jgi:serine/threonine-protein kinase
MSAEERTQVSAQVIGGRWRVERSLGEGGMGEVFAATELATGRTVAIKRLAPGLLEDPDSVARFRREARLLARLDHPSLVQLLSVDEDEAGAPFLVMKFVEGKTLATLLRENGRLAVRQALPLLDQLCGALDYLHDRGIVHRDLKPANVIVGEDGRLTVLDFGVSRQRDIARLTTPGLFVGTPMYTAPEQITDDDCGPAADLYALGLMTWELLVGEHPFGRSPRQPDELLAMQVHATPTLASRANPAVPPPVARVIDRALEKVPEARHPSARAFYEDLVRAFGLDGTEGARVEPSASRGPVPALLADAAVTSPPVAGQRPTVSARGRQPPAPAVPTTGDRRVQPWLVAAAALLLLAAAIAWGL